MKYTTLLLLSTVATCSASTIVHWGQSGGDTGIVTANASGINDFGTTLDLNSVGSPTDETSGYDVDATGQTRVFYGAKSTTNAVPIINNNGGGDRIQMVHNFTGGASLSSMVVWKSSDFLTPDGSLESMSVEFAARSSDGTTMSFLIQTSDGWYKSVQNDTTDTTLKTLTLNTGSLTWSGFNEFGVSGSGTADTTDILAVGLYAESSKTSGNGFIGSVVTNFEVTAVPEPSSASLLGLGALGLILRRRR